MRLFRTFALFLLVLLVLFTITASRQSSSAQTPSFEGEWETLRPEGEEFDILMPKKSTAETGKEPYHKMTLNTRLYLWVQPSGPVFAVASLSGIKANPALYSEFERVNSYVDFFRRWFPQKVRGKDAIAKLTPVGDKTLNGHKGREYRITIGDLSGAAQVYATRKRFYAVVALNTKKEDTLSDRFLSSFVLPERMAEELPNIAAQKREKIEREREKADQPDVPPSFPGKPDPKPQGVEGSTESPTDTKPADDAPLKEPGKRAPISGGVLNGKAISLPRPDYPAEARMARASGTVVVQITIDEYGNVAAARAVSGHPLLQQASVNAALQARFSPTFLMGEAVKVTGVITYNFVAQ